MTRLRESFGASIRAQTTASGCLPVALLAALAIVAASVFAAVSGFLVLRYAGQTGSQT